MARSRLPFDPAKEAKRRDSRAREDAKARGDETWANKCAELISIWKDREGFEGLDDIGIIAELVRRGIL